MNKIAVVFVIVAAVVWWIKDPTVSVLNDTVDIGYTVEYTGRGGGSSLLPMLVALHGNGDSAGNFYDTALDHFQTPARIVLFKGPLAYGGGDAWPFDAAGLERYGRAIKEAVDIVVTEYPTIGKPLLLGFSGGGVMAYYQAAVHGETYSYIFPVSGRLNSTMVPETTAGPAAAKPGAEVYAFHGKQDTVVSFSGGQDAAKLLREKAISIEFTEFDGGHQGIFSDVKSEIGRLVDEKLSSVF